MFYAEWWWDDAWQRKSLHTDDEQEATERLAEMQTTRVNPARAMMSWENRKRPSHKGGIAEAKALVRLLELGADIFVPWGHDHRADFIAASGSRMQRVQVKAAQKRKDGIVIKATSVRCRMDRIVTAVLMPHECDLLVGYSPATDECYAVKVSGATEYKVGDPEKLRTLETIFPRIQPLLDDMGP
jgi:hypothetical protein